ncbi:uncharacterized protein EV420DRAFT_1579860 [Desarmillaria tabescens]|uniref:Uncharacterized protein n=1 Tax=Armillaria tabescens TaxID=1929756 RepID=A0AA39JF78_ARMTA|nr:uncharacterized protein EV420DRAFT_1579860 [Desarmillaria tabescens]KAK0441503.1 hypothetical protein EV420DRAFT_1579860 [Desarmillaria tabescens]
MKFVLSVVSRVSRSSLSLFVRAILMVGARVRVPLKNTFGCLQHRHRPSFQYIVLAGIPCSILVREPCSSCRSIRGSMGFCDAKANEKNEQDTRVTSLAQPYPPYTFQNPFSSTASPIFPLVLSSMGCG